MDDVEDGRYRRIRFKHAKALAAEVFNKMDAAENKGPSTAELVSVVTVEDLLCGGYDLIDVDTCASRVVPSVHLMV